MRSSSRTSFKYAVEWLEQGRLQPAAMITQTSAAADARAAFDLVENEPEHTIKVQLAFNE